MQETGTIIAIPFIVFIFLAPIFGIALDKAGNRGYCILIGFFSLFISQLIFYKTQYCRQGDKCYEGIFPMCLLGISYTIIQLTLYPLVNYLIKERHFGTAYGIIQSISNIGLFVGPLVIGDILDKGP